MRGSFPALWSATITKQQSLLPYPYYATITVRDPHLGDSIYHAGFVSVKKRFSGGLVLLGSYTKAKLISDSIIIPDNFGSLLESNASFGNPASPPIRTVSMIAPLSGPSIRPMWPRVSSSVPSMNCRWARANDGMSAIPP